MKSKKRRFKLNLIIILSLVLFLVAVLILSSHNQPDIKNLLGELRTQKSFFDASVKIMEGICGNGVLEVNEECDDSNNINGDGCSSDCKIEKISLPPGSSESSGGGGGSSNMEIKKPNASCVEEWTCNNWNECLNGKQLRECKDTNNCGTYNLKPETIKNCTSTAGGINNSIKETPSSTSFISRFFPLFFILLIILILIIIFILYLRRKNKKLRKRNTKK